MYKAINIITLTTLAAAVVLSFTACHSDSELNTENENNTVSEVSIGTSDVPIGENDENIGGNSPIESVLNDSGADGYTICKIDGIEDYQLVLLYGDYEKECQYEFYTVGEESIDNIGSLDGSDITAYISDNTKFLCICHKNSSSFDFGSLKYDGEGINVEWLETVTLEDEKDLPDLPGKKVVFMPTSNKELIENLKDELHGNADEETVEIEE